MSDIYFNAQGKTHYLRILPIDHKPDDVTVYEAMVDAESLTYFEGHADLEIWELIELAVQSFLDYRVNDTVERLEWEGRS